jgi:hypothetical protein
LEIGPLRSLTIGPLVSGSRRWGVGRGAPEANPCSVCSYGWEHHEVSGWGGLDCSCSRASFPDNHKYHAHRRRAVVVEAQVAAGKNKATSASKATPAIDNWKGRVQREVLVERGARFRCAIRCAHRKGAPDGKPTSHAESWESRVRPGHPAPAATLPALPAAGESATPSRDGSRRWHPTANSARRRGAWSADRDHTSSKTWERNQPNRA